MKKLLVFVTLSLIALTNVQAETQTAAEKIDVKVLKHTNPMPNLMRVVMKYKDDLGLNENQIAAITSWKKANKPRMVKLVKKVVEQEKILHDQALNSNGHLVAEAQKMLNTRKNIIILKAQCRANLKSFLKKEQWTKLLELYKQANPTK